MKKILYLILSWIVGASAQSSITIENPATSLTISLQGGTVSSFKLKDLNLNPLHSYGHFICFDRWGPSTPEDQALGIPWHGEASSTPWTVGQQPVERASFIHCQMSCELPIVKLALKRNIYMDKTQPVYRVTETVSNLNPDERHFNLVQHATIGAPFLDETTIVNTNVLKGFDQDGPIPPTDSTTLGWPHIWINGDSMDTRYLNGESWPQQTVLSYILPPDLENGWITAVNPAKKLLIGYVWPTSEYPWLNLWQNLRNGNPFARGFEFGTTGLHQPWPTILETGQIFDHQLLEYISPDETITKSFTAFLAEIPEDYQGVANVTYQNNTITIEETSGDPERTITIDMEAIDTGITENTSNTAPDHFQLAQNYPNPFNASTRVQYNLSKPGYVKMELFNINGQKVQNLVDRKQPAGHFYVNINGDELSSGIYFCDLKINNRSVQTLKLVHQK